MSQSITEEHGLPEITLPTISLFDTCKDTHPSEHLTALDLVQGIRDGRWRGLVESAREALTSRGREAYETMRKTAIPAVTLSARVENRKRGTLEQKGAVPSGLCQLDFDPKDHPGMSVEEIRRIVMAAPFVVACFLSLSGDGIKGLALCPASFETHLGSWLAAAAYFKERGLTLDPSTKDDCRLCFVSYDPAAFLWDEAEEIEPVEVQKRSADAEGSSGTEDPEHVRRKLSELAEKIGAYQDRNTWLHICALTKDALGADAAAEIVDDYFPPENERGENAGDVMNSLPYGAWASIRKYGIDPMDYLRLLPDLDTGGAKVHSSIVWGVNSFPTIVPPETVVLGNAWLRRADIAHIISTAGAGKSVAVIQAAMAWALGLPYFGIRPPRPLRILLFSGEDDRVTLGQCRAGFLEHSESITGQKLTAEDLEPLDSMLRTEFSREHVGDMFHTHLARLLTESPADLVIVNPLLSYVGGEIVACASGFLRTGLMPVLQKHDCAALLAHHTGKMAKDGWDNTDDTYSGIGGGEVANVPRTILVLRPTTANGLSVVKVCKRKTTGWRDAEGNFTTSYFVKQSSDPERPAWIPVAHSEALELIDGSKSAGGTAKNRRKATPGHVVEALQGGPMKRQDLIEWLKRKCQCSEKPAKEAIGGAEFDELVSSFTETNPNGGHPLKWLRLAENGDQGVE